MDRRTLRRLLLLVGGIPLRAGLALLLGGQLEAGTARRVLAAGDAAAHVQPPTSARGGPGDARRRLVGLRALEQDALLLFNGYAARVVPAEPAIAGAGSRILAARIGAHPDPDGAARAACGGGAGEHLFGAARNCGCKFFDETIQQAVDGFSHSFSGENREGYDSGRWGQVSSPFANKTLEPTA